MTESEAPLPSLQGVATPTIATGEWQPLPDEARSVSGIVGALVALPFGVGGAVTLALLAFEGWPARIAVGFGLLLAVVALGVAWGRLRWRRTRWRLDERGLQVKRGWIWHSELLVPRTRVQHLDLERGPIERRYGLATLVVHTAGTRLHALRQSGFVDADAVALRDALLPEASRHDDAV